MGLKQSWRLASPARWLFLALCHVLNWRRAVGWGPDGHRRIASVAEALLSGSNAQRVHSKMQGRLEELAEWEPQMIAKYPSTAALHFHHQDPEWTCSMMLQKDAAVRCDTSKVAEGSLVCGLSYFYDRYSHENLVKQYPKSKLKSDQPAELAALADVSAADLTPTSELRWVVGLLGDMHQPLHILREHDYGREVKLRYQGTEYSLYAFFEDVLPKNLPKHFSEDRARSGYKKVKNRFVKKRMTELFSAWARETAVGVCTHIYGRLAGLNTTAATAVTPGDPAFTKVSELLETWDATQVVEVDDALFQHLVKFADDLTLMAGARVAAVLTDVLLHEDHRHAENHGQGKFHRMALRYPKAMLINFCIGGPVSLVLVFAFLWHEAGGSMRFFRTSKARAKLAKT